MNLSNILLIASGIAFFAAMVSAFIPKKKKGRKKKHLTAKPSKLKEMIFDLIVKIPLMSKHFAKVKGKIKAIHFLDEVSLKNRTITVIVDSFIIATLTFIGFLKIFDFNIYNLFVIIFLCGVFYNMLIQKYIGSDDELLEPLVESLKDLNLEYADSKIVEKSFIVARNDADHLVQMHLDKIIEILQKSADEAVALLKDYYKSTSNKFLKVLTAYSFFTKEYDDVLIDNGRESLYHRNINYLIREIRNEYRKRRNIKTQLIGQKFFVVLPLVLLPGLRWFALKFFNFLPFLNEFYSSSLGFVDMLICALISIFLYLMYEEVTSPDTNKYKDNDYDNIYYRLLEISYVKRILTKIAPKENSEKYRDISNTMTKAGKIEDMNVFYLKKILFAITVCIITALMIKMADSVTEVRIKNSLSFGVNDNYYLFNMNNMAEIESTDDESLIEMDHNVLVNIDKNEDIKGADEDSIKDEIRNLIDSENEKSYKELHVERIFQKFKALNKKNNPLLEVLIILFVTIVAYKAPTLKLKINSLMQEAAANEEVLEFQTIVMLLMYHDKSTVDMVLQWMIWFSDVFYQPLVEAKNKLSESTIYSGFVDKFSSTGESKRKDILALEELKDKTQNKEFKRLIKNLIKAKEGKELQEAFAGIEQDQKFSEDIRKDNIEYLVETKVAVGQLISSASVMSTFLLYFLLPVFYALIKMLLNSMQYINQFN